MTVVTMAKSIYHDRESNGSGFSLFDDPHSSKADQLYCSKDVNSMCANMAKVDIVRLVLNWHQKKSYPVYELEDKTECYSLFFLMQTELHTNKV